MVEGEDGDRKRRVDPQRQVETSTGLEVRFDDQGRRLCHAKGNTCRGPAANGSGVCRMHGGTSPQVKRKQRLRLMELVNPAIATLARELTQADKSSDRQAAANSILDRTGYGRTAKIDNDDARTVLLQRLIDAREAMYANEGIEPPPLTIRELEK